MRDLLKHAAEIDKKTFRKLIPVDAIAFADEGGDGWRVTFYRSDCDVLCAVWSTIIGAPQYYIIDINA